MTTNRVIRIVSDYYGVDRELITSKTRKQVIVKPKHVAQYLMWKIYGLSFQTLADTFHLKSHATAMSAVKKIEFYEEQYEDWQKDLKILRARIREEAGELSSPFLYEELTHYLMIDEPEVFVASGVSESDMKIMADKFKLTSEQIDELAMSIRERRKQKEIQEKDLLSKQHEDQLNKPKKERIKNRTDEQDTFGI